MDADETQLVLGRGEVYFEPFIPGTRVGDGERYIGNSTTFSITRSITRQDRYQSAKGQKMQRPGKVVSEEHNIQFITDNIDVENVGLWYGDQDTGQSTFYSTPPVTESFVVRQNRFYQLGRSVRTEGVRYINNLLVKIGATVIDPLDNYVVEIPLGRVKILDNAPDIPNGATVTFSFEWRTSEIESFASKPKDVFGALRFVARNPHGPVRNYYFPFVRIGPRGAVDLKGDEWQQMNFEAEAMRLTPLLEQVYVDGVVYAGSTLEEDAIIAGGLTVQNFPYWDDQLNTIVNIIIPGDNLNRSIFS